MKERQIDQEITLIPYYPNPDVALAKEKGLKEVKANIYSFNTQSQKAFESVGFHKVSDEWYSCQMDAE